VCTSVLSVIQHYVERYYGRGSDPAQAKKTLRQRLPRRGRTPSQVMTASSVRVAGAEQ